MIRLRRAQAVPLLEGPDWTITWADLREFLALVAMGTGAFVVWRATAW